jgi:rubrerythrin
MPAGIPKRKIPSPHVSGAEDRVASSLRDFDAFGRILDFAINEEDKACDFYLRLAHRMKNPWTKKAFEALAREELKQKERLLKIKRERRVAPTFENVQDLKVTEYVTAEVHLREEMDAREVLVVAIKAKQAAERLYLDLAGKAKDRGAREALLQLAQDEAEHRRKLETEYDDHVFAQN